MAVRSIVGTRSQPGSFRAWQARRTLERKLRSPLGTWLEQHVSATETCSGRKRTLAQRRNVTFCGPELCATHRGVMELCATHRNKKCPSYIPHHSKSDSLDCHVFGGHGKRCTAGTPSATSMNCDMRGQAAWIGTYSAGLFNIANMLCVMRCDILVFATQCGDNRALLGVRVSSRGSDTRVTQGRQLSSALIAALEVAIPRGSPGTIATHLGSNRNSRRRHPSATINARWHAASSKCASK